MKYSNESIFTFAGLDNHYIVNPVNCVGVMGADFDVIICGDQPQTYNPKSGARIIIAGSRHFANYDMLTSWCDKIISGFEPGTPITIISGNANGADKLGERYARERGYNLEIYPADWNTLGKNAGPKRNEQMNKIATHLIAFRYYTRSRGTRDMINRFTKTHGNKNCRVCVFK